MPICFANDDASTLCMLYCTCMYIAADNVPFQIVMDNVDKRLKVRHMTMSDQNKDYHWCNAYAVRNRVTAGKCMHCLVII